MINFAAPLLLAAVQLVHAVRVEQAFARSIGDPLDEFVEQSLSAATRVPPHRPQGTGGPHATGASAHAHTRRGTRASPPHSARRGRRMRALSTTREEPEEEESTARRT